MAQGDDAGLLGWVGAEMIITDPVLVGYITRVSDYTLLSYKLTDFVVVVFAVMAGPFIGRREAAVGGGLEGFVSCGLIIAD